MVKSKLILNKLEEKTKNDPVMKKFIEDLMFMEITGGQFKKNYMDLIEKTTKEASE